MPTKVRILPRPVTHFNTSATPYIFASLSRCELPHVMRKPLRMSAEIPFHNCRQWFQPPSGRMHQQHFQHRDGLLGWIFEKHLVECGVGVAVCFGARAITAVEEHVEVA